MKAAKILKDKINAGAVTTGVLCTEHVWPTLVEICQKAGLDYLIVDQEHGVHSDELAARVCQLGRLTDFAVLIRTISTEESVLRRALDIGPCGLLIPAIEETSQLDRVRSCLFMPPRGKRRPGGMGNRWMRDYHYQTWLRDFEAHAIIIPQIETKRGLDNAAAIAAHEVATALGVGPYDLSASLGCCWDPQRPELQAALQQLRGTAAKASKKLWMGMGGRSLVEKGYSFICLGEPSYLLGAAMEQMVQKAKGQAGRSAQDVDEMPVA